MTTGNTTPLPGRKAAWTTLLVITLIALAIVLVPVWIIQPFKPQSARGVEASYALRRWSPWVTLIALALGLTLVAWFSLVEESITRNSSHPFTGRHLVRPAESFRMDV